MNNEWAMILGGASCVWDDVEAWERIYGRRWDGITICVNDIGSHWPRKFQHWVSSHPVKFKKWWELRTRRQHPECIPILWGQPRRYTSEPLCCDVELMPWGGGSSGMFAAQVAYDLRCTRAVLCGIPMTVSPHFGESREPHAAQWSQADPHWRSWIRHAEKFRGWTKSMSGRTRELLGEPTLDWLYQKSA